MKEQLPRKTDSETSTVNLHNKAKETAGYPSVLEGRSLSTGRALISFGQAIQLQRLIGNKGVAQLIQRKMNETGMPDELKSGVEQLSGQSLDDVKVHYNSDKPAQLQAQAYAEGTDIHIAPGQERNLAHEAWHVVQQRQGRVKPTMQMGGAMVNDDVALEQEADVMGAKAVSKDSALQRKVAEAPPAAHTVAQETALASESALYAAGHLKQLPAFPRLEVPSGAATGKTMQLRHILQDFGAPILTHAGTAAAHKLLLESYAAGPIATRGNKTIAELFADFAFENQWAQSFDMDAIVDTWTPAWNNFLDEIRKPDPVFDFTQVQARWKAADNQIEQAYIATNNRARLAQKKEIREGNRKKTDINRILRNTEVPGIDPIMAQLLAGNGVRYENKEGELPKNANANYYMKLDLPDSDHPNHRGARRVIMGLNHEFYYTAQHYESGSFNIIVGNGATTPY
ncbi:eCIS core domain-containing protein [Paenibacillus aceris]|uniref:eCIS core domain-containing protein n=1 Tax=Paenibacillus aceris TaxID=869555 RepID=A0ABS4I3Q2_9BACL|nr:ribonuclease domain-containing protein [Paenibacillus aceris]MBP1965553.1 hypothetical protein [Paenibacillus aceris]